jgi:hypothetical protein
MLLVNLLPMSLVAQRVREMMDKSQAYFWTKEWQEAEREREASEDIKAGRVKAFDTVEELLEDLG